jgi:hypothetical protein
MKFINIPIASIYAETNHLVQIAETVVWAFLVIILTVFCLVALVPIIKFLNRPRKLNLRRLAPVAPENNGLILLRSEYWIPAYSWPAQFLINESYKEFVRNWGGFSFPFIGRIWGRLGHSRGRWVLKNRASWSRPGTIYLSNLRLVYKSPSTFFVIPFNNVQTYDVLADGLKIYTSKGSPTIFYTGDMDLANSFHAIMQRMNRNQVRNVTPLTP